MRLRRGPPRLRHADGDSHRSGEFHRGDLVGHDERFPLRGQPATGPADSLQPRIDPATATAGNLDAGISPAGNDTDLAGSTGTIGHVGDTRANGKRQLDLAERFVRGEQQRAGTSPHTGEAFDRDAGRYHLRGSRLRGVEPGACCRTSGRHSSFPFLVRWISRRLELQPPSSPGLALLVGRG